MTDNILWYLLAGFAIVIVVAVIITRLLMQRKMQRALSEAELKYHELDKQAAAYRAETGALLQRREQELASAGHALQQWEQRAAESRQELQAMMQQSEALKAKLEAAGELLQTRHQELQRQQAQYEELLNQIRKTEGELTQVRAENRMLDEKLRTRLEETRELQQQFHLAFERTANQLFEAKSKQFSELSREQLKAILDPLGANIAEFKKTVAECYQQESNERFSLGEKVKELAQLNNQISEEARKLARALRSESKAQGRWGEIILESILEKSGLSKGREYELEAQLTDADGRPLRSGETGKRMRPDAIVRYPDGRSVIIDAKVSLSAYLRSVEADSEEARAQAIAEHVEAVRTHILTLSSRGYDDYGRSLDFVMMFVPNEPAYLAAVQAEPDLWQYAYDRRILLLSPANLITALRLVVDLWKREKQNRHALDIADRGAKLYDKFVGFVVNLQSVGQHIEKAKDSYNQAWKQLVDGRDNLIGQADKLRKLGIKARKELPAGIEFDETEMPDEQPEQQPAFDMHDRGQDDSEEEDDDPVIAPS